MTERWDESLAAALGATVEDVDRVAMALALAERDDCLPSAVPRSTGAPEPAHHDVSDVPGSDGLLDALAGDDSSALLARGRALLHATLQLCGDDPLRLVDELTAGLGGGSVAQAPGAGIVVTVGQTDAGDIVRWRINEEGGRQTAPHLGIAGQSGQGKSQLLLQVLASITGAGMVILDYKGDISDNADFLRASGARVIKPGVTPIPVNPFHLPEGTPVNLVPSVLAEVFAEGVGGKLGDVQRHRLERAMRQVYEQEGLRPGLDTVQRAIEGVYADDGAGPDRVLSLLQRLTSGGLFAKSPTQSTQEFIGQRWVIDLHDLQGIEVFVALVLLNHLHQIVRTLPDAARTRDPGGTTLRALRSVIAIDEAHYYLKGSSRPLLDLVRIGRSKGVAVFLSSQSLSDFRRHDVLNEQLPTLFLFRHGAAPTAAHLRGALGLSSDGQARRVRDQLTALEQFHAFTTAGGIDPVTPIRVRPFFET